MNARHMQYYNVHQIKAVVYDLYIVQPYSA